MTLQIHFTDKNGKEHVASMSYREDFATWDDAGRLQSVQATWQQLKQGAPSTHYHRWTHYTYEKPTQVTIPNPRLRK